MTDNSPSAFPTVKPFNETFSEWQESAPGMSLRDYFAAAALQGLLAFPNAHPSVSSGDYAKLAYKNADAMLKERAR